MFLNAQPADNLRFAAMVNRPPCEDCGMSPADREVLTSLPRTRPTRRSAKRGGPPAQDGPPASPAAEPAPARRAPAKAPAANTKKAATTAKPKAAGTSASRAKARPAAKPRTATTAKATSKAKANTTAAEASKTATPPPPPPAGWASAKEQPTLPSGPAELLGTAVQAVGELAQIGLTFGGQALKQALSRLNRP
jgi:hypothetical protein